jgi:hypothetical protein
MDDYELIDRLDDDRARWSVLRSAAEDALTRHPPPAVRAALTTVAIYANERLHRAIAQQSRLMRGSAA